HTPAVIDGGEHVTQAFSLLLLPLTLLDGRRWHWQPHAASPSFTISAHVFWLGLRVQASIVYLEAAVAKLGVEEWRDGTALYYWVSDPVLGSGPWVSTVVTPLMDVPFIVVIATWGVIALELLLAAALVASTSARR